MSDFFGAKNNEIKIFFDPQKPIHHFTTLLLKQPHNDILTSISYFLRTEVIKYPENHHDLVSVVKKM